MIKYCFKYKRATYRLTKSIQIQEMLKRFYIKMLQWLDGKPGNQKNARKCP